MKPILKISGTDYTEWVEELAFSDNDLDADGAGRNLLDGLMHRSYIATKEKITVKFLRLSSKTMSRLLVDTRHEYLPVTVLDAKTNRHVTRQYTCSTINKGIQRYIGGDTVYDGVTFNLTER